MGDPTMTATSQTTPAETLQSSEYGSNSKAKHMYAYE